MNLFTRNSPYYHLLKYLLFLLKHPVYPSFVTTMSQLKICDFSGETFKGFEVLQFSMSATTTQLLSSGEFCKQRYDTIPVKSASANVSFYTSNSKMPNFGLWHSCRKWAIRWLRHCATSRKVMGSIPDGVIGIFHWYKCFRSYYGSGFDSASKRNEYQEYFLGGKGGRCVGLTNIPPSCAECFEIWEPHPPGTVWACPCL